MQAFSLAGRTVLLTGAARGIGQALLAELVERKVERVLVVGREVAQLRALEQQFSCVEAHQTDLSDQAQLDGLLTRVAGLPHLSVLINNAGSQRLTDLMNPEADGYRYAVAAEMITNFSAPVQLCVSLLPQLLQQPSAMIVNVTSGLALAPKQSAPVYCATKAALRSFTKSLRYQAHARAPHIRIVEALPPLVDTNMTKGRGSRKMSAEACAAEIADGMVRGLETIYVGKAKLLRVIHGLSPSLADRLMRNG